MSRLMYTLCLLQPKVCAKVLVNGLVKLAQEKSVARWTDRPDMTMAVDWDVKNQTKQQTLCLQAQKALTIL